ncbi:hypothetical protein EDD86DRAFT_195436 [Gorgonomyces haynaldii]|nr:hypothetical protein EDD86DRAFT_195436 [Gorgonomyces haynaldii]
MSISSFVYGILFCLGFQYVFERVPIFRYYTRQVVYNLCLAVASIVGMLSLLYLVPAKQGHKANQVTAKTCAFLVSVLLKVRVEILSGLEHLNVARPCVFLINHQSNMDISIDDRGALLPRNTFILGKKEIKQIPFIGQYFVLSKNILIDRSNRASAIDTMGQVAKKMIETKSALWMYPEGTRSHQDNDTLLPFKKGAFHLAIQGKMPVVPIVMATYAPCYNEKKRIFEPCTIQVKVLPPMQSDNIDQLMADSAAIMGQTLKELKTIPRKKEKSE